MTSEEKRLKHALEKALLTLRLFRKISIKDTQVYSTAVAAVEEALGPRNRIVKLAGKAHSDVRRLGKAEVAGSIPVASSNDSIENWVGPSVKDPIIDGVLLSDLKERANQSCRCDGGNNNCSACVAERKLRRFGYMI